MAPSTISQQVLEQLPLGVMLLDEHKKIVFWNHWLTSRTGIDEKDAIGLSLSNLFPSSETARFDWAFSMVVKHGMSQVLSQVLNHYLIPIKVKGMEPYGLHYMQQHIELMPIKGDLGESLVMVCIIDVTMNVVKTAHAMETEDSLVYKEDIDAATDLYNRRYMWQWLRHQFLLASRLSFSVSVIIIEFDVGDHVTSQLDSMLKKAVDIIMHPLRRADCVMRFDDKRLVILLPSCELQHAVKVAENLSFLLRDSEEMPICYFGVSSWSAASPCTSEELIMAALKHVQHAKVAGSDSVCAGNAD